MVMKNLERLRRAFSLPQSRGPLHGHDMVDSLPYPFEDAGIQHIFLGANVLEIGPGNGRQFERLLPVVKSYSVADVSPEAMALPVFNQAKSRFVLDSFDLPLSEQFDIIHFWYVLHHISESEFEDFFRFLSRHIYVGGFIAFNCPEPINVQGPKGDDEVGTFYSDPKLVEKAIFNTPLRMIMALPIQRKSTGWVVLLHKRD